MKTFVKLIKTCDQLLLQTSVIRHALEVAATFYTVLTHPSCLHGLQRKYLTVSPTVNDYFVMLKFLLPWEPRFNQFCLSKDKTHALEYQSECGNTIQCPGFSVQKLNPRETGTKQNLTPLLWSKSSCITLRGFH